MSQYPFTKRNETTSFKTNPLLANEYFQDFYEKKITSQKIYYKNVLYKSTTNFRFFKIFFSS